MIAPRSIRLHLLALIALLLLVVLGGFGFIAWQRGKYARMAAVDRSLQHQLDILLGAFRPEIGPRPDEITIPVFPRREKKLLADEKGAGFYSCVWAGDGRVQWHSDSAPDLKFPIGRPFTEIIRTRGEVRELVHFTPTGRCFLVGRNIHDELTAARSDAFWLASVGAGVLVLGLAAGLWIATLVTRPLREISRAALSIAAGDLSQRINLAETQSELGAVAATLNETFARLEAAFARQTHFTADASHELRTPVALILTHAEGALHREHSAGEYREALSDCAAAAERMNQLIEALLLLARFDASSESLRREPCDLALLAEECTAQLRPLAEAKKLTLHTELSAAPGLGDPVRLAQVITNLLANAIQFTPTGGEILIRTERKNGACFVIRDNGPGISTEDLPRLFERFHRSDASRNRATGGTGLGLAICKSIIEAHHGVIEVQSTPGQGSEFTFVLPEDE